MINISKFIQINDLLYINKHDKLLNNIAKNNVIYNTEKFKLKDLIVDRDNKFLSEEDLNFFSYLHVMGAKFAFQYIKYLSLTTNNKFSSYYNYLINELISIEKGINLCLISDEKYCLPLLTILKSLLINRCKNHIYNIFILYTGNRHDFIEDVQSFSEYNFYIKCIPCNFNTNGLKSSNHISPATYIKFDIPNIFKKFDKMLYLDTDIIILKDLMPLWKIQLEKYYFACVEDPLAYFTPTRDFRKRLNTTNKKYFNAGVLLLNLKKLREDGISLKLYQNSLENNWIFADQDAFNAVAGHNCKYIPYYYNITGTNERHMGFENLRNNYFKYLKNNNWEKEGYIYHFTATKPWWDKNIPFASVWYKYFSYLPKNIKNKYKNN